MKLVSWNVNGIRACVTKGFLEYFHEIDADIFCLQENSENVMPTVMVDLIEYRYTVKQCEIYSDKGKLSERTGRKATGSKA